MNSLAIISNGLCFQVVWDFEWFPMASARKVRNANKRYAKINDDWKTEDTASVPKNKVRVSIYEQLYFFFSHATFYSFSLICKGHNWRLWDYVTVWVYDIVVLYGLSSILFLGILCFLVKSVVSSMVLVVPTHLIS